MLPDVTTAVHRELIVALAVRHRLPAAYSNRYFVASGGLVSYGVDIVDLYRRAASYVDRILKGAKPSDLPVQAPTKFELVVNLKAAKAIGLTIPESFLPASRRGDPWRRCPLLALSRHELSHRTCLLLTQSGHRRGLSRYRFEPLRCLVLSLGGTNEV